MELVGTIEPPAGAVSVMAEWITLIGMHPSLTTVPPQQGINPFTKGPFMFKARQDAARVLYEGARVGFIEWAQDDSQVLVVFSNTGVETVVTKIAVDVASRLGWKFSPPCAA
jgi:hypothetical protein